MKILGSIFQAERKMATAFSEKNAKIFKGFKGFPCPKAKHGFAVSSDKPFYGLSLLVLGNVPVVTRSSKMVHF
jgi:hypothetical protein